MIGTGHFLAILADSLTDLTQCIPALIADYFMQFMINITGITCRDGRVARYSQ